MSRVRAFVSFDLDHDNDLKKHLFDQAAGEDSHLIVVDWSIREVARGWTDDAHRRIANADLLLVICGEHTATARGVHKEIEIARQLNQPYLLLDGRPGHSQKPWAARPDDRIVPWNPGTWRRPVPVSRGVGTFR